MQAPFPICRVSNMMHDEWVSFIVGHATESDIEFPATVGKAIAGRGSASLSKRGGVTVDMTL